MTEEADGGGAPLNHARQVTIDALCDHFANDVMSVEEFERRVDVVHKASSADELKEILRDLPGGDLPAVVSQETQPALAQDYTVTAAAHAKEKGFVVAVLSRTGRTGRWQPARSNYAIAVCGRSVLDFREAVMGPGVTDLRVYATCGRVKIIVPPGLNVESDGIGLLGRFDHVEDAVHQADRNAPTLRVTGLAVLGRVEVSVRHPGETARDARRRGRQERREKRKRVKYFGS